MKNEESAQQTFDIILEWVISALYAIAAFAIIMFIIGYLLGSTPVQPTPSPTAASPAHTTNASSQRSKKP